MRKLSRWAVPLVAMACVALQFRGSLLWSACSLATWASLLAVVEPAALRRLWMPKFWVFSAVLALASGVLLGHKDAGVLGLPVSRSGLQAGALMIVRGGFLFALTSWAARRIAGEDVQRAIRRVGLARFGTALSAAFGLIPELTARLQSAAASARAATGSRLATAYAAAVEVVCQTAAIASDIARGRRKLPPVAAVIGPPGSGKTSLIGRLRDRLEERGLDVRGISQPAIHEDSRRIGYRLRDLSTGEELAFATRGKGLRGLGYRFADEGWAWARERLAAARAEADVVAVDELGKLEARGEGHLAAVKPATGGPVWLVSVREDCAPEIEQRLGGFALRVSAGATQSELDDFTERLAALARHDDANKEQAA